MKPWNLKITNSVFRLTEHSNPPQIGGLIFISGYNSFSTGNVTFDATEFTGKKRISIISAKSHPITFNGTEILCPQGMMIEETLQGDKNRFRHYTCIPACLHGEYTYQSGAVVLSGNSESLGG